MAFFFYLGQVYVSQTHSPWAIKSLVLSFFFFLFSSVKISNQTGQKKKKKVRAEGTRWNYPWYFALHEGRWLYDESYCASVSDNVYVKKKREEGILCSPFCLSLCVCVCVFVCAARYRYAHPLPKKTRQPWTGTWNVMMLNKKKRAFSTAYWFIYFFRSTVN